MAYGKGFGMDLASIYQDKIGENPKMEAAFLENIRVFIPTIERVTADTRNGTIKIRDKAFPNDNDIPLHQYGDGANKLFRILVMMALHKGERLMIDEIDAGIHFTRFKAFWKTILKNAYKDQTQLIVTTHNEECIEYFTAVLQELGTSYEAVARVVQMKKVNQQLQIHSYSFESFNLAVERGFELRGGMSQ
jgi:AAA15 family ATPase/GTPase